jgi:uncharacterized repeat protein (TIGR02543 family)
MVTIHGRRSVASWVAVAMLAGGVALVSTPAQAGGLSLLGSDGSSYGGTQYPVRYDANSGSGAPTSSWGTYNASVTLHNGSGISREGHSLDGWTTGKDGSGTRYNLGATIRMPFNGVGLYAHWKTNQYSVGYDANAGTGTEPGVTADFGSQVSLGHGDAVSREGYALDGWNTAKDGSGTQYALGDALQVPSHGVSLYAHWRANKYGVHYDANSGDGVETDQVGDFGSQVTLSRGDRLGRDGYALEGWTTDPDGSGTHYGLGDTLQVPSRGVSLYAHWKANTYGVQYDANAGDGSESAQTADFATTVTLRKGDSVSRTGYSLDGWDTDADGTGTRYSLGEGIRMPSHHVRLYAHWTVNTYDVSYEHNDGTGSSSGDSKNYGDEFQVGHNTGFDRPCYTLDSWNTQADGSGHRYASDEPVRMPYGGLRLYAHWTENSYAVTYDANAEQGEASAQTTQFNNYLNLSAGAGLDREGYTLDGWTSQADGSGTLYTLGEGVHMPCNGMRLYGHWTINKYKVWYERNDGSGDGANDSEDYGREFKAGHGHGFDRPCYTLDSWNANSEGTGHRYGIDDSLRMPYGGVHLFAHWTEISYDVTYAAAAEQGDVVPAQTTAYNSYVNLDNGSGLTREGYTLDGWTTEADGTGTFYGLGEGIHMPCRGVHLYGHWKINSYALRYDANGGTGSEPSQTRTYASILPLADGTGMSRTGYTIVGWNTKADGTGTPFALGGSIKVPCHSLLLYAQWITNDYTVTYEANGATGGSVPDTATFTVEAPASIAGNTGDLVRPGYVFSGWTTGGDAPTAYSAGATYGEAADLTLRAVWVAGDYAVVYNATGATGGSVPDTQAFTVEAPATIAGNTGTLVRTGYVFLGWSSAPDGAVDYVADTSYSTPATLNLYAVWTAAAVTIPPTTTTTRHATSRTVKPLASVAPPAGQTWVLGSLRLLNPTTKALATKVVTKYGVWTLATRTGAVTFAPMATFTGTARVGFRVTSSGGLVSQSTVTVIVLPAKVLVRSVTVYFTPMSAALSPQAKATLKALAASVLKLGRPTSSVTTGYVQATSSSANDRSLSAARARNVAAYLTRLGLPHATSARGLGKAYDTGWKARRATATITFTIS